MSRNISFCINIDVDNIVEDNDKLKFACDEKMRNEILNKFYIDVQNDQEFLSIAKKCNGHVYFSINNGKAVYAN